MRTLFLGVVLLGCSSSPKPAPPPTNPSIDVARVVREELDAAIAKWKPSAAVAIVLHAKTGAVLADVAVPAPRAFVTGSTLKTITIAAALDDKAVTPDTKVDCATRTYPTGELHDAAPHGALSITDVLAVSSNVGTSRVYDLLGPERTNAWFARFHLDIKVASDGLDATRAAIGALAEVPPMQMAAAYAPLVNGGTYVAGGASERVLREDTAATVLAMLENAVNSDIGTGKLARIPGHRVAGKTGTGDHHGKYYGSFIGTVLDGKSPLVILVGFELPQSSGYTGASVAAPTFAQIAAKLVDYLPQPLASKTPM